MENRLGEIRVIQKKIVSALEQGEDVSSLSRELARVRAEIAAEAEVQELKKIADQRQALRDKAEVEMANTQSQGAAIDILLQKRDKLLDQLKPLLEPMRELALLANPSWEHNPGSCYLYPNAASFQGSVTGIPRELLPVDFACPTLEMTAPGERSLGQARQALQYFEFCIGILQSHKKGTMAAYLHPTNSGLLLDVESENEGGGCVVCQSSERAAIDQALKEGVPLRTIEAGHGISRSSLSRHKNNCLNLGAIRMDESPASSANKTFFRG
jgi:hypothetical protein